jgi:hypothetical protein
MTLLSQPRTARVVTFVSPESISATSEPGSAQPIWCARPPLAAFDAQGHIDRQRYRFGLGVSYRLRAAVVPRSSPRLDTFPSGLNGAKGSD